MVVQVVEAVRLIKHPMVVMAVLVRLVAEAVAVVHIMFLV
jgi:hypothetical protein